MKKILVFIDSSLGELDWISPFLVSKYMNEVEITIFLRKAVLNNKNIKNLNLDAENIKIITTNNIFHENKVRRYFFKIVGSILKRLNRSKSNCKYFEKINNLIFNGLKTKNLKLNDYDFIFRDTGFHQSFEISYFKYLNPKSKVIAFPHCINIGKAQKNKVKITKSKCIDVNLILENSILSKEKIENQNFFISGVPAFSNLEKMRYDFDSKNVLILTRDIYEPYGCSRKSFLEVFENSLKFCEKHKLDVFIKHHPRDKNLDDYRNIQKKFKNVSEINQIFDKKRFRCCLSAYSSAGVYLTSESIPVFDISPYEKCLKDDLTDHFCDTNGYYTHDFIELEIQSKLEKLEVILDMEKLDKFSSTQFTALKKYFLTNANEKIYNKLMELI